MGEGAEAGLIFSYSCSRSVHKKEGVEVGCAPNNFEFLRGQSGEKIDLK